MDLAAEKMRLFARRGEAGRQATSVSTFSHCFNVRLGLHVKLSLNSTRKYIFLAHPSRPALFHKPFRRDFSQIDASVSTFCNF